ncbi:MAG: di-trans,poly-cis-decaprenylcistransferase [Clostridia bacterium]|nr:di-trans,poly-cis-decaprenylcistransferase [Clostridia bacterium]
MGLFRKTKIKAGEVDLGNLPRHIAIIMDGNGRWAKKRGLPRTAGHAQGAETFRTVATYCKDIGIEYLTVYAFSTENWRRPQEEVSAIMGLLEKYLYEATDRMERDRVKMKFFGDTSPVSPKLKALIERTNEISSHYEGCQVNICLNYGGRDEILRAAVSCAEDKAKGMENAFTEGAFSKHLWSAGIPDPELIIRPGGEMRLSNFLLWQAAYSELYFTEKLWPDFSKDEINRAIAWFQTRERRFGGV